MINYFRLFNTYFLTLFTNVLYVLFPLSVLFAVLFVNYFTVTRVRFHLLSPTCVYHLLFISGFFETSSLLYLISTVMSSQFYLLLPFFFPLSGFSFVSPQSFAFFQRSLVAGFFTANIQASDSLRQRLNWFLLRSRVYTLEISPSSTSANTRGCVPGNAWTCFPRVTKWWKNENKVFFSLIGTYIILDFNHLVFKEKELLSHWGWWHLHNCRRCVRKGGDRCHTATAKGQGEVLGGRCAGW